MHLRRFWDAFEMHLRSFLQRSCDIEPQLPTYLNSQFLWFLSSFLFHLHSPSLLLPVIIFQIKCLRGSLGLRLCYRRYSSLFSSLSFQCPTPQNYWIKYLPMNFCLRVFLEKGKYSKYLLLVGTSFLPLLSFSSNPPTPVHAGLPSPIGILYLLDGQWVSSCSIFLSYENLTS